ncbi:double-strand break repair helicase AddA [Inquilinus sp. CAU 1745]|uniref:double-strand break repair helicase AddA n=1 Tax=Inquilinus sp. CAU 1745 TaxID=3140369 RepID=UPI00325ADEB1
MIPDGLDITPDVLQRRAADPEASVWVGASAGTGKTKVLTDRVLRLMLVGTAPEKILCLTFTKAAAAEMANRVNRTLAEWAVADEATLEAALAKLLAGRPERDLTLRARRLFAHVLDAPGGLKIQTIHAFCQSLLRRFPLEAGLPPHFKLMDERTAAERLESVRNELLQTPDGAIAEALDRVTAQVGEDGFSGLMADLTRERGRLARLVETFGDLPGVFGAICGHLGVAPGTDESAVVVEACADAAFDGAGLKRATEVLATGLSTDVQRGETIGAWLADPAGRSESFERYLDAYLKKDGDPRAKLITAKPAAAAPDVPEVLAAEQERLLRVADRRKAAMVAANTSALLTIGHAMVEEYRARKEREALLDFDDLILTTARLLHDPGVAWVLFKLDGGIDHILIDEAQDTNPDQWQVVAALVEEFFAGAGVRDGDRTLFVVGDDKQSIFSFQRADPAEFARMRAHFQDRAAAASHPWRPIALNTSFRSTAAVLDVVDAVFAQEAARDGVGTDPAEIIAHRPFRMGDGGLVELWPSIAPPETGDEQAWSPPTRQETLEDPAARLARHIAGTIRRWLDDGEVLESKGRPVMPGDIMVLVRTRNRFFAELVRTLKERRIPVAGLDRMVLTRQLAVMDLLALADFLLLPDDDLILATVLKGPLVGWDDEKLFDIAYEREGTLWVALSARAAADDSVRPVRGWLAGLLAQADFVAPHELFAGLLVRPCPADAGSGRRAMLGRLGFDAEDPLEEFLSLTLAFEQQYPPSLQRFLHWVRAGESQVKRELDSAGHDQVRIMTVHGSKGLQAPIVFLPDTTSVPDKSPAILWPDDGMEAPLWAGRRENEDSLTSAARTRANRRRDQEYRRLLYVALTRAEDRLYICGHHGSRGVADGSWHALCAAGIAAMEGVEAVEIEGLAGPALRHVVPQTRPPAEGSAMIERARPEASPPDWLRRPPPVEPEPTAPLTPSRPDDSDPAARSPLAAADDGVRFRRGRLVHALLQVLPDLDPEGWDAAAARYLGRQASDLPEAARQAIAAEILAILRDPAFGALFGPGSRAEIPVVGTVGSRTISGQIDRLVVTPTEIMIVDYKTNRPPPQAEEVVPVAYLRQMAIYRSALQLIYPGRTVECALLWTDGPRLMRLTPGRLDPHAP